jgi:uncharacterized protein YjbJ (UPF0337 family)
MAGTNKPGNMKDKVEDTASSAAHTARETASNLADKARDTASSLADKARDTASSVADRARDAASNIGDRARDAASNIGDRAEGAKSAVGSGMSSLAGTIRQSAPHQGMLGTAAEAVADRLEAGGQYLQQSSLGDMGEDVAGMIRQYPVASLLAVFGIGFLLGSAMRR